MNLLLEKSHVLVKCGVGGGACHQIRGFVDENQGCGVEGPAGTYRLNSGEEYVQNCTLERPVPASEF